jgi:hypothetical protein
LLCGADLGSTRHTSVARFRAFREIENKTWSGRNNHRISVDIITDIMPLRKTGKKGRIERALKAKEPQLVEGPKILLALRGPTSSAVGVKAMKDLVRANGRASHTKPSRHPLQYTPHPPPCRFRSLPCPCS